MTESALPSPAAFAAAAEHSRTHPMHILGPYEDADGVVHIYCDGTSDPYEPSNCDFSTEPAGTEP